MATPINFLQKSLDLQMLINKMCKVCKQFEIISWVKHVAGKQNVKSDALSRYKRVPDKVINDCANMMPATKFVNSVQMFADSCRDVAFKL